MHVIRATMALTVVAAACSRARPALSPGPTASFSFVAETAPDSTAAGARFEGSGVLENGWLTVLVPAAVVTLPPGDPENWRNLTVRAYLATDYNPGAWKAAVQSRPVNVFRFLDFSRTPNTDRRRLKLETPLRFVIPLPPGASLETSRLAIELEWVIVVGQYGETEQRIAFSGPLPAARPFP